MSASEEDRAGMRATGPIGFILLMVGFGLRLDSDWQALATLLLLAGAAACAMELLRAGAFVGRGGGG